jgi:DNA-binding response OmpR family regulator
MPHTATLPATARILLVELPPHDAGPIAPALEREQASVRRVRLTGEAFPAAAGFDLLLVRAVALDEPVRQAVQHLREVYPGKPVALWSADPPAHLAEIMAAGVHLWLPWDAPAAAVVALTRRLTELLQAAASPAAPHRVAVRNLTVDFERCEVAVEGQAVALTPTEFRILAYLAGRPGRVVSHAELFREVHGYEAGEQEAKDILKVHIWRLRNKLNAAGAEPNLIVNVRGFGYMLERRGQRTRHRPRGEMLG